MTIRDVMGWRDIINITVYDLDGNPIEIVTLHNKITTVGLNMLRDMIYAAISDAEIKYMAWGDDNTAVSAAHTTLQNERGRKLVTSQAAGGAGVVTTTTYVSPPEATGFTVEELGWFAGAGATGVADSGIMVGRVLYSRAKTTLVSWNVVRTDTFTEV